MVFIATYCIPWKVSRQKSFVVSHFYACLWNSFICKFKVALFKYGFKRRESFLAKGLCVQDNLPWNFSASKLLWCTVHIHISYNINVCKHLTAIIILQQVTYSPVSYSNVPPLHVALTDNCINQIPAEVSVYFVRHCPRPWYTCPALQNTHKP